MKEEAKAVSYGQTLKRLAGMVKRYLRPPHGKKAWLLLGALLVLIICINGLNVANSYVGRYFMSAIERRDWAGFGYFAWLYAGVFALQTLVAVLFRFSEERLGLHWRDWLTRRVVGFYTNGRVYLHLKSSGTITNPDQRISEDIRALTTSTLSFSLMILNGTMTAISFSGVLWSISPKLFAVAVIYAAAGSALTILFGKPLVRLNYRQSDFEADFRSELMRVRSHAEAIALSDCEPLMRERLMSRVNRLVENFRRIISVNRNLGFFTTGYNFMIQLIPTLIVAPLFMREGVEFGVIGQSAMAFAALLGAFSLVVTQFQSISAYASVVARLGEFTEGVEKAADRQTATNLQIGKSSDHFEFRGLTLDSPAPERRTLVGNLDATFAAGTCVVVGGENDAARKALFHAAAGLHGAGLGALARPPDEQVAFLPEQPYLPPSQLRQLLLSSNGHRSGMPDDQEVKRVLEELGLASVIERHDGFERECQWEDILSFEERQLMAVARAVLTKPSFVLIDRLESALQPASQQRVLRILKERGISPILFTRMTADPAVHDAFLDLRNDGSWRWTNLKGGPGGNAEPAAAS